MHTTPDTSEILKAHPDSMVSLLEELLSGDSKCENSHRWENDTCSIEVTHRALTVCPKRPVNLCANAASWLLRWMDQERPCSDCKRLAKDCWTVIPV